jgi:hypothetical protein
MHGCLDQTAKEYAFPITSERCPKSYVEGRINCVLALMEALVRVYWKKDYAKVDVFGRELMDIVEHGLVEYEVLGTKRDGYYLFRRGI